MPSGEEKLKSIKTEIRSLIVSSPVGLTIEKFLREYKECIGFTLPFNDFGHKNAQDFLNSMPDVVQLKKTASGILLVPVENELVSHINDLVSKQRNTRKKSTFKPRMTTVDKRRYYQVITCKNKNRRPKKRYNIKPEGLNTSDSSVDLDDIDNLHIGWTIEYPTKHFSNIMSYGQTKEFSPPRRPSPISTREDKLETIKIPQTTSCKEYDDHENSDECRTSQLYAVNKTNCCSQGNLPSLDSESGVASDQFSLDYKSGCNSTSRSADNESSISIFDSSDSSTFGDISSMLEDGAKQFATNKYGQTLHYVPIGRSSYNEKDYVETPFQLQPKSSRFSDTNITLKEDNQKSTKTCTKEKKGNDFYVSEEHEIYLTALAHGIVLDPSKIIDPYKHLLSLVQSPNIRNDIDINLIQNLKIRDDVDTNLIQNLKIRDDVDINLIQSPKIRDDVDINLIQSPKIRDDVDINLIQNPIIRDDVDINSSSTSLKECELNIGFDVKDKYAANNDVIKINNKIISHFTKMFNDKLHCSNENTENESILRNDSSEALTESNVNKNSSHESICDRNYFHPENAISEENIVRKDFTRIDRGLFVEKYMQSKEKRLGCTNEKISPYCNSLSFGRGSALKNLLEIYQEGKSKALGDVSSGTKNQRGGIGRGHFLKIMQKKYFQVP